MKIALCVRVNDERQGQLGAVKMIDMAALFAVAFFGLFLIHLFQNTKVPHALVPVTPVPSTLAIVVPPPVAPAASPMQPPPMEAGQPTASTQMVPQVPRGAPPIATLPPSQLESPLAPPIFGLPRAENQRPQQLVATTPPTPVVVSQTETIIVKSEPEITGTPRLTKAASVKGFWWRSLPRPPQHATADYDRKVKFCDVMEKRLLSGYYDLDAEKTALEWNAQEYARVGDVENAKLTEVALKEACKQLSDRAELRRLADLKEQELELKKEELALNKMGLARMNDMSRALNRIAFQMLIGNALEADENGMVLNYWETSR